MASTSCPLAAFDGLQGPGLGRSNGSVRILDSYCGNEWKSDLAVDTDTIVSEILGHRVSEINIPLEVESTLRAAPTLASAPPVHVREIMTVAAQSRHSHTWLSSSLPSDPILPILSAPVAMLDSQIPSLFDSRGTSSSSFATLRWRLASGYFACFIIGWADGVTGTVMPYVDAEFHLTTMTSSLLWAGTTCGFFIGTFLIEIILKWLGRFSLKPSKRSIIPRTPLTFYKAAAAFGHSATQARYLALLIASTMHACYFIMMGSRGGFPVMLVAYAMAAFARALLTALLNAYFAAGPKQALGFAYGIASFGSVASPLVCQATIAAGVPWFHFYYGSLVLSGINVLLLALTFKPGLKEFAKEHHNALCEFQEKLGTVGDPQNDLSTKKSSTFAVWRVSLTSRHELRTSALKLALLFPYQWALSIFALLYCGSETTTQGFMVTYLLSTKHANPKTVGYVTSGFWAGISLGRFAWGYCNELGSTPSMLAFVRQISSLTNFLVTSFAAVLGLVLQVLVWVVKSHVQDSVAASFIGVFYGPVFPAVLAMANDVLPEEVHMVSMALINAFASLGGAVFPVVTGTVLSLKGISAFTLVTVPLAGSLAFLWGLFPSNTSLKHSAV